jgi:hypothetical protein
MTPRFNLSSAGFARRFFGHFDLDDATVAKLRALEARGTVVYVMRYSSRLDYFLFNTLFLREGLRLSRFANGIRFYYYRPPARHAQWVRRRRRSARRDGERSARGARELTRRGAPPSSCSCARAAARPAARARGIEEGRRELDLLGRGGARRPGRGEALSLVPLALFWRKGPRAREPLPEPLLRLADASLRPRQGALLPAHLSRACGQGRRADRPRGLLARRRGAPGPATWSPASIRRSS